MSPGGEGSQPPADAAVRLAIRAYGGLCRFLPVRLQRFRGSMVGDFAGLAREARRRGRWSLGRVLVAASVDVLRRALTERVPGVMARVGGPPDGGRGIHVGGNGSMAVWMREVRYAWRALVRRPFFALVVVLTLALGLGLNVAIFAVVNGVLLRPLPYPAPDRLVRIWGVDATDGSTRNNISPRDFLDWRRDARSFRDMGAFTVGSVTLTGGDVPVRISTALVTQGFFGTLGIAPALGRPFTAEEYQVGGPAAVILSHGVWEDRYGGDPAIVGRSIEVDGAPATVVGIMPPGFTPPTYANRTTAREDLWVPLWIGPRQGRGGHWLTAVGRLRPGATLAEAQGEMDRLTSQLERTYPNTNTGWSTRLQPLRDATVGDVRPALLALLGAVVFVLLIACANLANLYLTHAETRIQEMAIRTALGAGRGRIAGQLLAEALLPALLSGAVAVPLAHWGLAGLRWLAADRIPRLTSVTLDPRVLVVAVALAVGAGLAIGLLPALRFVAGRARVEGIVASGPRGGTESRRQRRIRATLVVVQTALALVLLVGATLMVESLRALEATDPGFHRRGVLTAELDLPRSAYPDRTRIIAFYQDLIGRVSSLPGVAAAGAVDRIPLGGSASCDSFDILGRPWPRPEAAPCAEVRKVAGNYFGAMGIRVLQGRALDARDAPGAPRAAVINQTMARTFFSGGKVLGQALIYGDTFRIVGVISDVRHFSLALPPVPEMYFSAQQTPTSGLTLVVHARSGDAHALIAPLRRTLQALDPSLAPGTVRTTAELLSTSAAPLRFRSLVLSLFGGLALLLAMVGIYAVMAYTVARQTREIGVRMALGARPRTLLRRLLGRSLATAGFGVLLGLAGALALARLLAGLLYRVSAYNPIVFTVVPLLLLLVAGVAAWLPGRRATQVDPVTALRVE